MTEERIFSNLMKEIKAGNFVLTGELEPEVTSDCGPTIKEAIEMKPYVTAANCTDNPKATCCISSLAASHVIQRDSGLEIVYQLTTRDMNRMALGAAILGAGALGLKNILALTGDHHKTGNMPKAKPVFDYDSTHLIQLVREMVDKRSIEGSIKFDEEAPNLKIHVGGAANPNAVMWGMEPELMHVQRKAKAGVEFLQTQVVYDIEVASKFLKEVKDKTGVPVLLGIFPMKGYDIAKAFNDLVPGVKVPADLLARFKEIKNSNMEKPQKNEAYLKLNADFFGPMLKELKAKGLVAGCHIMAVHFPKIFKPLTSALGIKPKE